MIGREMFGRPIVRAAAMALAASTLMTVWTLVRALRADGDRTVAPALFDASGTIAPAPARVPADLGIAVLKDVFSPDRTQPDVPYRMPEEEEAVAETPAPDPVLPVVLGTAYMGEGRGFATCQLGDGRPVIVHVGDKLGEYAVKSIERGRVVFSSATGKRLEIPALKTGS